MLRPVLRRDAQRLKAMAAVATIVFSAAAPAGSILQVSQPSPADGLGSFAGIIDYGADDLFSMAGTLTFALRARSPAALAVDAPTNDVDMRRGGCDWASSAASIPVVALAAATAAPECRSAFAFTLTSKDAESMSAVDARSAGVFDVNPKGRIRGATGEPATVAATVVPLPPPVGMGIVGLIGAAFVSRRLNRRNGG
jgi:hypothetical protein